MPLHTKSRASWESHKGKQFYKTYCYPTILGRHVFCTIRQSMTSMSIAGCARLRLTLPSLVAGHKNRPRFKRLVSRHAPWPSHQIILI